MKTFLKEVKLLFKKILVLIDKFFTKIRKMSKKEVLTVVVFAYAIFGAYSLADLLKKEIKETLKSLFVSSSTLIIIQTEEPEEVKDAEEVEIIDCYTASEVFSKQFGINKDLMDSIIKAESNNNPKAKNKVSTARGCAQYIIGSWESYGLEYWGDDFYSKNVYNPKDNVELMAWIIANYGTSPWNSSKAAWNK